MKIYNIFSKLSSKEIKRCLSFLPKEYKECNIPIYITNKGIIGKLVSCWLYKKYMQRPYIESLKDFKYTSGTHIHYNHGGSIAIIINTSHKYTTMFVLFHELRHWFQLNHLNEFYIEASKHYNRDTKNMDAKKYQYQKLERDANNFAKMMCKRMGMKFLNNSYTMIDKNK